MSGSIGESNAAQVFTKRIGVKGDLYSATLAANLVLDGSHGTKLYLTPTAARDVTMPALDLCVGVTYQITNAAAGDYALTIKDAAAETITTIAQGEIGWVHCTGEAWQLLGKADLSTSATPSLGDQIVVALLALGASGAGVATKALALTLTRSDGSAITSARDVMIRCAAESSPLDPNPTPVATVTFSAATVGSIVASDAGWAIVRTSAAGAFACTCTDSADETIEFWVPALAVAVDATTAAIPLPNAPVSATWA